MAIRFDKVFLLTVQHLFETASTSMGRMQRSHGFSDRVDLIFMLDSLVNGMFNVTRPRQEGMLHVLRIEVRTFLKEIMKVNMLIKFGNVVTCPGERRPNLW